MDDAESNSSLDRKIISSDVNEALELTGKLLITWIMPVSLAKSLEHLCQSTYPVQRRNIVVI